jgi:hypothetical protein
MAAVEPLEPKSGMNRELHDAPAGLCQQVGITTETTYESLHNAVDSILDEPRRAGSEKSYTPTMKATAGDEVIMSIAGTSSAPGSPATLARSTPTYSSEPYG